MGRRYTIPTSVTLANAGTDADLLEIIPASAKPISLVGLKISQSSEIAEAQEESLRIQIVRLPATVTSGSGGSSPTVAKTKRNSTDPGVTAEANNTTLATSSGTAVVLEEFAWNVRGTPLEMWWTDPRDQYDVVNGEVLCIRCQSTPADDMTFQITAIVDEEG